MDKLKWIRYSQHKPDNGAVVLAQIIDSKGSIYAANKFRYDEEYFVLWNNRPMYVPHFRNGNLQAFACNPNDMWVYWDDVIALIE